MAKLTIVAKVVARQDAVEAVKAELIKMVAPTRLEEGCIDYSLHQDLEDPATFIFYENWENSACLQNHINSAHYRAYVAAVEGLIAGKKVHRMNMLA